MKKFSILILSLILIFAFTSCSEGNVEYADSEVAKDLINSIKAEAVAEDLISAAGNGDVQGLDISYVFQTKGMTIEEALAADAVTIDVTGTFSNENGGYTLSGRFEYHDSKDRMTLIQYCAKRSIEIRNK